LLIYIISSNICLVFILFSTEKRRPRLGVQRACGDDNTTTGELRILIVQYLLLVIDQLGNKVLSDTGSSCLHLSPAWLRFDG